MPKILDRLVSQLKNKPNIDSPYAVAVSQLQKAGDLKKGSLEATKQGVRRGAMTPRQREAARRYRQED